MGAAQPAFELGDPAPIEQRGVDRGSCGNSGARRASTWRARSWNRYGALRIRARSASCRSGCASSTSSTCTTRTSWRSATRAAWPRCTSGSRSTNDGLPAVAGVRHAVPARPHGEAARGRGLRSLRAGAARSLERIARRLHLPALNDARRREVDAFVSDFLDEGLRHSRFGPDDIGTATEVARATRDAYLALYEMATEG